MNQQGFANLLRLLATVVVAVYSTAALAQGTSEKQARKADARKMVSDESVAYRISLADDRKKELALRAEPVQSWTNDVSGEFYGSVFLWILDGRPEVVGSLYRSYSPYNYFAAELQSLSERELLATKDEAVVWQPPVAVKFQSVPNGGPPSETRPGRLIQMRSFARRFAGKLTDEEKVRRTLQILPQPLYRYEKTPANLLDGALFSLVSGTDPEVLLLIEARRTAGGFQWLYALARLSIRELRVTYDGQAVWNAASLEKPYTRLREPYTIIQRDFDAPNRAALITVVLAALASPVFSQVAAPDEQSDKERAELTLQLAKEKAAEFEFHLVDDRSKKLTLYPRSLLRWSNPVATALYGEVFLWTAEGRPEIIASMHKFFQPNLRHMTGEFHSLSLGTFVGRRDERAFWAPQEAGVTLAMLPGAPPVARTSAQRLSQMRAAARRFSAETSARNEPDSRERLRLLPKPIYRYESNNPALLDGAIFAFVQGTNPEVLLLLEARQSGDERKWQYALARFNSVAMRASYDGQQVWSVPQVAPPWEDVRNPRKAYFVPMLDPGTD